MIGLPYLTLVLDNEKWLKLMNALEIWFQNSIALIVWFVNCNFVFTYDDTVLPARFMDQIR